ncbi:MAG: D-2-hydroxyacid dehydrogenase [Treponemataceae bacterium]|nr:MAG: D-2-hydroxyacid dehydrogenase [Treponemataceae bacterium]
MNVENIGKKPKIVILDGFTSNPGDLSWDAFEALGELTVYPRTAEKDVVSRIGNADALIINKVNISGDLLEQCPSVRYIGELATGYNNIDLPAAKQRGITVCNIPSYSTNSVAQLVFAFLLEIAVHPAHHSAAVFSGRWTASPDFAFWDFPLIELAGKTLGLIGYGHIGKTVARTARALGMTVNANSKTRSSGSDEWTQFVPLEKIWADSDVISLHCPLFPETREIINAASIAKMKDGVILLNTGRGALIDEKAVSDALNSGKIYGAGLDVLSQEPPAADNPLLKAKNCIITPHIAWASKEARGRLVKIAAENLAAFIAGAPQNTL